MTLAEVIEKVENNEPLTEEEGQILLKHLLEA